ncbi:MAG TPA: dienelactone hydrolase family protein, partial [Dongiaceae bacterium]|nr:dienelactone hydrolase family protein [Dongiaceae bacterium]
MIRKTGIMMLLLALMGVPLSAGAAGSDTGVIPPGEAGAKALLERSPRHHEWVDITIPGKDAKLSAFVAYPERKTKAPLVIVIHEVYGLTDWVRAVADRLAGEGF